MAENESMEGKDLAREEQRKEQFESMIKYYIDKMKDMKVTQTTIDSPIKGISISIQKQEQGNGYEVYLVGEKIVTVTEDEVISYEIKGLKNVADKLKNNGRPIAKYDDLGLPDIEYLEYLEKERDKREEAREMENQPQNTEKEQEESEEELDEDGRDEEEKDDKKPELNKKQPNWIKLDLSAQVVYNKTLAQILPNGHKYKEVYVAPGKNQFSYELVGGDEQSGYEPIEGLEKTEGSNPTQKIISIQNQGKMDIKSEQAFAMFKIKGRESEGFSINLAQSGNNQIEVSYWRKSYGDSYISIPVAQETADRGYNEHSPEARYFMARSTHSNWRMDDRIDDSEDIEKVSAKLPSEINPASDGIQLEELDKQTFREKLIERIMKDVMGNGKQHPDYERSVREKATIMADKIIDGMDPAQAKEEVFGPEKEQGGITPDQKRNREGQ